MRSGSLRGSIYLVLLLLGRFGVSQTIIPEATGHFLIPSAHRHNHPFGGLGLIRGRDSEQHDINGTAGNDWCTGLLVFACSVVPDRRPLLLPRITSNQMLLNFGRTRSPGRSSREIGDSWTPSSEGPAATHRWTWFGRTPSGALRLIDTLVGSPNSRYENLPTPGFFKMPGERRARSLAASPPTAPGGRAGDGTYLALDSIHRSG